ncbi:MAG: glycogen/starch synthase [Candidatus Gastranaerophilales bacterium]|nr:glycogen/starch synthase [Candidatus Gastranaerophilales bacterium]MCM1073381.1 glycogen/starch synthase [Bacteroides sp.]
MRTEPISLGYLNFKNEEGVKDRSQGVSPPARTIEPPKKNTLPLITAAVAIASLGVSTYALKGRNKTKAMEESKKLAEEAKTRAEEAKKAAEEQVKKLENEVKELKTKVDTNEATRAEKQQWTEGYLDDLNRRAEQAANSPVTIQGTQVRNLRNVDNLMLIQNVDNSGKKISLPETVIDKLRTATSRFVTGEGVTAATLGAGAAIWLPTAESTPEKEGGLGEVPVQLARNYKNEFGIDNYLVRPLNEIPGKSTLIEKEGRYYYWYAGMKDQDGKAIDHMEVEKVMDFDTHVVRNGQYETQKVEVFYGIDPANGFKRIMFRNPDFFGANGLYKDSQTASEPERYNFFSKLVYEFAKIKADPKSKTAYNIYNQAAFESIKAPEGMILNDWHTAPVAALMRLMAPVEGANGELNADTANSFEKMNLLYIVHNSDYHGWGGQYSSDMLNTLFDKYAFDIYKHADTGFTTTITDADGDRREVPIDTLSKVLTVEGTVNMANMGMTLATKVKPVSPTYAQEIATETERGKALTHVAERRLQAGTMEGQSNGWDRSVNEISASKIGGFNGMLNRDKLEIFKYTINHIEGITDEQRKRISAAMAKKSLNINNFAVIIEDLRKLDIPQVSDTLAALKEQGITELRTLKPATADMDMDSILEARSHNKKMFFESLRAMLDFNRAKGQEIFNFKEYGLTDLSDIDIDKLDEVPFYNMGVRFVSQKGVDIAAGAWENILRDWDTLYPGKTRPIVAIGGVDAEDGKHRNTVTATKQRLGNLGRHLIQMDGFTPNPIWMAGSDWTMRPSYFEPDGDKWESLYKGTPAVLTRTGGHVDSVQDGVNGILTGRTMKEIREQGGDLTQELIKDYTEALKRTLNAFYGMNGETTQRQFVDNAIHGNQSWVIKDKDGKIVECPSVGHLRDLGFDLSQFDQISDSLK